MKIKKIFLFGVLLPVVLGIFSEEVFGSLYKIFASILFLVSIIGSFFIFFINKKEGPKTLTWYVISVALIAINLIFLFLLFSFHPGF